MFCRTFGRAILTAVALLAIPCLGQDADPVAEAAWPDRQYGYVARNESLRSLLYDFGTSVDIPVIVSARISVVVNDRIPVMSGRQFLAEIHTRFGVIWVYDGTTLYLYDATEAVSETVELPFAGRDAFQETVDAAGIMGVPLNWVFLPADGSLQLSGPPRFVEWGAVVAGQLAEAGGGSAFPDDESFAIRIFEVEYGYVDPMASSAGGRPPIAGLAEMVAKLMNVSHLAGVVGIDRDTSASGGVSKLRGTGVIRPDDSPAPGVVAGTPGVVGRRGAGEEAFVVGDPRLNAVIVRDRVNRMPIYERLIAELDTPVDQIEIAISVLDIDVSAAAELQFALETDSLQVNAGADAGGDSIHFSEGLFDVDGIGLRIRALRNSANSRVLTRPSVTTLDNHEASFRNDRTFYVRLGGNDAESVDLAPVSYGWVARIRPHVIYDGDDRKVQLAIHIEDGNRGGSSLAVTGVPEVAQNVIRTQAAVREGKSLLIGGYTVREQTRFRQRIPLLGRVPLVGRLFSTHADRDQSIARYFLITPTILPTTISYEINTGFDGPPLDGGDAVKAVEAAAGHGALPPRLEGGISDAPVRHEDARRRSPVRFPAASPASGFPEHAVVTAAAAP